MRRLPTLRSPGLASTSSRGYLPRRAILLLAIVAVHLLVILWLASGDRPPRVVPPAGLSVFTVALSSGQGASAQRTQKKAMPPPAIPVPVVIVPGKLRRDAAPSFEAVSAPLEADASAGGCALAREVGQAIGQNPAAMAELDALPPNIRTSADAVMLWNGQWLDPGIMPAGIDTGSLRGVVEQVVAHASPECREAKASGPQFLPVPEGDRTVMIVVGSGTWRWADLIAPPADCPPTATGTCSTTDATPQPAYNLKHRKKH